MSFARQIGSPKNVKLTHGLQKPKVYSAPSFEITRQEALKLLLMEFPDEPDLIQQGFQKVIIDPANQIIQPHVRLFAHIPLRSTS